MHVLFRYPMMSQAEDAEDVHKRDRVTSWEQCICKCVITCGNIVVFQF